MSLSDFVARELTRLVDYRSNAEIIADFHRRNPDFTVSGDEMVRGAPPLPEGPLAAPTLIDYEVLNAFRRQERLALISETSGARAVAAFERLRITRHEPSALIGLMWAMRAHLTAYDASYVALAQALGAPLVTSDVRLARAAETYCDVIVSG
jgi:predicted nucleic acid-binding protein